MHAPSLILTHDGSHSLRAPQSGVTYHSIHGALTESQHVFIEAGLQYYWQQHPAPSPVRLVEIGWGTGLNSLLACQAATAVQCQVQYIGLEPFPIEVSTARALNYSAHLGVPDLEATFLQWHTSPAGLSLTVNPYFTFQKWNVPAQTFQPLVPIDVIFMDAFAPTAQPELWTPALLQTFYHWLAPNGVWVTYCAKGDVKRALRQAGFVVETLAGAPGKREMIRALKLPNLPVRGHQ